MFNCKKSNPGIELKNRIEVQNQIELKIELKCSIYCTIKWDSQLPKTIFDCLIVIYKIAGYTKYFWNKWRAIVSVVLELPFLHLYMFRIPLCTILMYDGILKEAIILASYFLASLSGPSYKGGEGLVHTMHACVC